MNENVREKISIQISICTRKRPVMLQKCLESFQLLKVPEYTDIYIFVVENDDNPSAQGLVEKVAHHLPFPVQYCSEPRQGISIARNRALFNAIEKNTDYLAFIDDDEWVTENWLVK